MRSLCLYGLLGPPVWITAPSGGCTVWSPRAGKRLSRNSARRLLELRRLLSSLAPWRAQGFGTRAQETAYLNRGPKKTIHRENANTNDNDNDNTVNNDTEE